MKKKLTKAIRLFERFTGHSAKYVDTVKKPEIPDVALVVGKCIGIMYETTRDGVKEKYIHEFRGKAKPTLITDQDGNHLFLIGGTYTFTEAGITDN